MTVFTGFTVLCFANNGSEKKYNMKILIVKLIAVLINKESPFCYLSNCLLKSFHMRGSRGGGTWDPDPLPEKS